MSQNPCVATPYLADVAHFWLPDFPLETSSLWAVGRRRRAPCFVRSARCRSRFSLGVRGRPRVHLLASFTVWVIRAH